MRFNRTSEYALNVFIQMVNSDRELVSVKALHRQLGIPYKYLAALMRRLTTAEFLVSIQGKNGGYRLARPASEIKIRQIINVLEGPDKVNACILGNDSCTKQPPCPMHRHWINVSSILDNHVYSLSLADLASR